MKKLLCIAILLNISLSAETLYSFSNISLNYLDWDTSTQNKTTQKDFAYISLEGGAGWDWGNFYGNVNIENPTKSYTDDSESLRYTAFGDFDINIKNGFKLHLQNFSLKSNPFYVNDFVVGGSYKYMSDGFWIKPFIGIHHTYDTYFSGFNGYMLGWVLNYDFEIFDEKFALSQWNEIELKRKKEFYEDNGVPIGDGKSYGFNGQLSLWWYMNNDFTSGLQYRYAKYKLGNINYQSAIIYTLKYNF